MLERPDSSNHLMEELYDSAIPELLAINFRAVQEVGRMISRRDGNAPDHMELKLTPDFMVDNDRNLLVDSGVQQDIATEVLAGLHEAWTGSKITEFVVSNDDVIKYWEFVDVDNDFTPWVVVEEHDVSDENRRQATVSAYMLPGEKRPLTYQKLLNGEIDMHGNEQPRTPESGKKYSEQSVGRSHIKRAARIAKALRKVTKPPTGNPYNRWY